MKRLNSIGSQLLFTVFSLSFKLELRFVKNIFVFIINTYLDI